jgi:hypothetical protein
VASSEDSTETNILRPPSNGSAGSAGAGPGANVYEKELPKLAKQVQQRWKLIRSLDVSARANVKDLSTAAKLHKHLKGEEGGQKYLQKLRVKYFKVGLCCLQGPFQHIDLCRNPRSACSV